ncbi:hypothetical protein ACTXT7_001384 [Hymenolepis weldensis]
MLIETAFLENEVVSKMAKNYLKNPHQILIRRAIQRDLIVLCNSTDPHRIRTSMNTTLLGNNNLNITSKPVYESFLRRLPSIYFLTSTDSVSKRKEKL